PTPDASTAIHVDLRSISSNAATSPSRRESPLATTPRGIYGSRTLRRSTASRRGCGVLAASWPGAGDRTIGLFSVLGAVAARRAEDRRFWRIRGVSPRRPVFPGLDGAGAEAPRDRVVRAHAGRAGGSHG